MKRILFGLVALAGLICFVAPATANEPRFERDRRPVYERIEHRELDKQLESRREEIRRENERREWREHHRR